MKNIFVGYFMIDYFDNMMRFCYGSIVEIFLIGVFNYRLNNKFLIELKVFIRSKNT